MLSLHSKSSTTQWDCSITRKFMARKKRKHHVSVFSYPLFHCYTVAVCRSNAVFRQAVHYHKVSAWQVWHKGVLTMIRDMMDVTDSKRRSIRCSLTLYSFWIMKPSCGHLQHSIHTVRMTCQSIVWSQILHGSYVIHINKDSLVRSDVYTVKIDRNFMLATENRNTSWEQ